MGFKRVWDSSCPHVWVSWDGVDGVKWVIRDLRPEDDEEAIEILVDNFSTDEVLCKHSRIVDDPVSLESIKVFWRGYLSQRMSLGCYEEKNGNSKLVALNVCLIHCQGEADNEVIEGKAWTNVYNALILVDSKQDIFKFLGLDKVLYAYGLVVRRNYRGLGIGAKLLAAREHLALHHGVKGTSTVFTGPASQISAERAGFATVATVTWKELAEAGLDYTPDETKCIKLMAKKYV